MDKNTLSIYGWAIISSIVLISLFSLAVPLAKGTGEYNKTNVEILKAMEDSQNTKVNQDLYKEYTITLNNTGIDTVSINTTTAYVGDIIEFTINGDESKFDGLLISYTDKNSVAKTKKIAPELRTFAMLDNNIMVTPIWK